MYLIQSFLKVMQLRSTSLNSSVPSVMDSLFIWTHIMKMSIKRGGGSENCNIPNLSIFLQIPKITYFFLVRNPMSWPICRQIFMFWVMSSELPINGMYVHICIRFSGIGRPSLSHGLILHMGSNGKKYGWWVLWAELAILCKEQSCSWYLSLLPTLPQGFTGLVTATIGGCLRFSSPEIDIYCWTWTSEKWKSCRNLET